MKLKITLYCLMSLFCMTSMLAQNGSDWSLSQSKVNESEISYNQDHMPSVYTTYSLNIESLKRKLINAPIRGEFFGKSSNVIALPNAEGKLETYSIMDTQIMHPELAAKFPSIHSYIGQSLETPGKYARFTVSNAGFHAQIFSAGEPTRYIDPLDYDKTVYIEYSRADMENKKPHEFVCDTDETLNPKDLEMLEEFAQQKAVDDGQLRQYRLALSCTGEYSNIFSSPLDSEMQRKADVMSQMVVAMDRVNGVYELEMGVTFQFIANNDLLIYLDPVTDPWTDEHNDKTQEVIDMVIGYENYDIGHNFNNTGGGNAGCIGCICAPTEAEDPNYPDAGSKGSGHTGLPNPTGDPFYIDYVSHEMGHQMGGYHTHNATGTCLKTGNNTEVEPGSGSTIMGYAGICPGQDIQNQSDDYFHYVTIRDISANIQTGVSSQCPTIIQVGNQAPTADAGPDRVMPIGTAFALTGIGSDPDAADVLTYTWEQNDIENMQGATPMPAATAGPMFRSRRGTTSPTRFFPQMSDILDNNLAPTWEVIPQATRDFEFALTVRDNVLYGGQTADDTMNVSSTSTAGPFTVVSQSTPTTWTQGQSQAIIWNVANTNIGLVNSQIVDILFSAEGDFSDTMILASSTPNDGTENITVPSTLTNSGRLMVKAADHIFLAVNAASITINESADATFFLETADLEKTTCTSEGSIAYNIEYTPTSSQTEATMLSATGLPTGATVNFDTNPVSAAGTVAMTIDNLNGADSGMYTITVTGTTTAESKTQDVTLNLQSTDFGTSTLNEPPHNMVEVSTSPMYMWAEDPNNNATSYSIEVSDTSDFSTIIESAIVYSNSYRSTVLLNDESVYYWRIKPINDCGEGNFTSPATFTTGLNSCTTLSNNTPVSTAPGGTVVSTINVTDTTPITDVNVILDMFHEDTSILSVVLISPAGTRVDLTETDCAGREDIDAVFDDSGSTLVCSPTAPAISGTIKPESPLSALNGENPLGTWTLEVSDLQAIFIAFGGINSWSLEFCGLEERVLGTSNFELSGITMYPNPSNGVVNINFNDSDELDAVVYDLQGRRVLNKTLTQNANTFDVSSFASGAYLVKLTNKDNQTVTKQLIVE